MKKQLSITITILLLSIFTFSNSSLFAEDLSTSKEQTYKEEMHQLKMRQAELKTQQKLLRLENKLKLSDNQQSAWETYKSSLVKNNQGKQHALMSLREKYKASGKKPNAIELASVNLTHQKQKLLEAKQQFKALEVFYAKLNSDQQVIIDKVVMSRIKHKAKQLREMRRQQDKPAKKRKKKQ